MFIFNTKKRPVVRSDETNGRSVSVNDTISSHIVIADMNRHNHAYLKKKTNIFSPNYLKCHYLQETTLTSIEKWLKSKWLRQPARVSGTILKVSPTNECDASTALVEGFLSPVLLHNRSWLCSHVAGGQQSSEWDGVAEGQPVSTDFQEKMLLVME